MRQIIEEYGEAIVGVLTALLIIGIGIFLFRQGGIVEQFYSSVAGNAI